MARKKSAIEKYSQAYKEGVEAYMKGVEDYRRSIENFINDLTPKVNKSLAVTGFLLMVLSVSPVIIIVSNASISSSPLSPFYLAVSFLFCITAFIGYMLLHKSTERDWL